MGRELPCVASFPQPGFPVGGLSRVCVVSRAFLPRSHSPSPGRAMACSPVLLLPDAVWSPGGP